MSLIPSRGKGGRKNPSCAIYEANMEVRCFGSSEVSKYLFFLFTASTLSFSFYIVSFFSLSPASIDILLREVSACRANASLQVSGLNDTYQKLSGVCWHGGDWTLTRLHFPVPGHKKILMNIFMLVCSCLQPRGMCESFCWPARWSNLGPVGWVQGSVLAWPLVSTFQ